jgi:hypothetical protein
MLYFLSFAKRIWVKGEGEGKRRGKFERREARSESEASEIRRR